MDLFTSSLSEPWLFQAVFAFLLAGSAVAVVVGAFLMTRSATTFRFLARMNHWVSTRKLLEPAEAPRDVDSFLHRRQAWLGFLVIAGAGTSLWLMLSHGDLDAIVAEASLLPVPQVLVDLGLRVAGWTLVVGHLAAIAIGVGLIAFPAAMAKLETATNRSFSMRARSRQLEFMHLPLDRWAERHPWAMGLVLVTCGLGVLLGLGGILLGRA